MRAVVHGQGIIYAINAFAKQISRPTRSFGDKLNSLFIYQAGEYSSGREGMRTQRIVLHMSDSLSISGTHTLSLHIYSIAETGRPHSDEYVRSTSDSALRRYVGY